MNLILASILFISAGLGSPGPQLSCTCTPAAADDLTRWGGNELVIVKEKKVYKELSGTVSYGTGHTVKDALVEVYTDPEYLLLEYPESQKAKKKQRRMAACVTGEDGKFCFGFIEPGKYEVRVSLDPGVNVTHIYVEVDPYGGESPDEGLNAPLTLGT